MPTLDLITRFIGQDAGGARGYITLGDAAKQSALGVQSYTDAQARATATERAAADAAVQAADLRIRASAALRDAQAAQAAGDDEAAAAAERQAEALRLQATAARQTSVELNAVALAARRQAASMDVSGGEGLLGGLLGKFGASGGLFSTIDKGLSELTGGAEGLTSALGGAIPVVGGVVSGLGGLATSALHTATAVGGVGLAISAVAVDFAQKFQTAMTKLNTQANVTRANVAKLSDGILHMSASVATTPNTLADAAYHIASIGQGSLSTAQQLHVLRVAAEGAKVGGADLVDVTNTLDAALVAHVKGVHDYAQVMGVLNSTVGAGDMQMQDLADALGPLSSTFKGFNVTIQQAGAALAVFGDNNLRGALAGSQLRQSITSLADPLLFGQAQLQQWGIQSGNLTKQLRQGGLTAALDTLSQKLHQAGYTAKTMGPILAEMFGKRGPQQGLSMLINELDRYHQKIGIVTQDGRNFASSWQGYTKTFGYAWDQVKAAGEKVLIQLGDQLLPTATKVLHWLATSGVHYLEEFGAWFKRSEPTFAAWGVALVTVFREVGDVLFQMVGGFLQFSDVLVHALPGIIPGVSGVRDALDGTLRTIDNWHQGFDRALTDVSGKLLDFGAHAATSASRTRELAAANRDSTRTANNLASALGDSRDGLKGNSQAAQEARGQLKALVQDGEKVVNLSYAQGNSYSAAKKAAEDYISKTKQSFASTPGVVSAVTRAIMVDLANVRNSAATSGTQAGTAFTKNIESGLRRAVSQAQSEGHAIGADLDAGVAAGIRYNGGTVFSGMIDLVHAAAAAARAAAKSHSPSLLFRDLALDWPAGIALGVKQGTPVAAAATVAMVNTAAKAASHGVDEMHKSGASLSAAITDGLLHGFKDHAQTVRDMLTTQMQDTLNHLQTLFSNVQTKMTALVRNARATYQGVLKKEHQYEQSLAQSMLSQAALSNATQTITDPYSGAQTTGPANLRQFEQNQLDQFRRFHRLTQEASTRHLSQGLLAQIEQMGPAAGIPYLRQILSGADGSIASLNRMQKQIAHLARESAGVLGQDKYGDRAAKAQQHLHDMVKEQRETNRHLAGLAYNVAHELAKVIAPIAGKPGHYAGHFSQQFINELATALRRSERQLAKGHHQ